MVLIKFCQIRSDISAKTASLNTVQNKHHGFITLLNIINLALYNLNTCTRTFVSSQLETRFNFKHISCNGSLSLWLNKLHFIYEADQVCLKCVNSEVWFICLPAESKVYDVSCLSAEGWVSFAGDISETLSRGVKSI